MTTTACAPDRYWHRRAAGLRSRFNFGWWLHYFLQWLTLLSVVFAAAVVWVRSSDHSVILLLAAFGAALLLSGVICWIRARPRFLSHQEALIRLEFDLGLQSRLTSAAAGISAWPQPEKHRMPLIRWNATRVGPSIAACIGVIAIALAIRIPGESVTVTPAQEPESWQELESLVELLEETELVQTVERERLEEGLQQLRQLPPEDWFSHEGLEAGDSLLQSTRSGTDELRRNLELASSLLETARQQELPLDAETAAQLNEVFEKTLEALATGQLAINEELLEQFRQLSPSQLRELSQAQWQEIQKNAQAALQNAAELNGRSLEESLANMRKLSESLTLHLPGGVDRGPGEAPLDLSKSPKEISESRPSALPNASDDAPLPGDRITTRSSEPETSDTPWAGPVASGGSASTAGGSRATWSQGITPQEQESLRKFFRSESPE